MHELEGTLRKFPSDATACDRDGQNFSPSDRSDS